MSKGNGQSLEKRVERGLRKVGVPCSANDGHYLLAQRVLAVRSDLKRCKSSRQVLERFVASVQWTPSATRRAAACEGTDTFYQSQAWLEVRYQVLKKYGPACMLCGRTRKDGAQIHVDHIKPRYHFPELELTFENLQVLCRECNLGKRAHDDTDWRPPQAEAIQVAIQRLITPREPRGESPHLEVQDGRVTYVTPKKLIVRRPKQQSA
jgi:5-methylcytosine-specific restriction endonuclease McrA